MRTNRGNDQVSSDHQHSWVCFWPNIGASIGGERREQLALPLQGKIQRLLSVDTCHSAEVSLSRQVKSEGSMVLVSSEVGRVFLRGTGTVHKGTWREDRGRKQRIGGQPSRDVLLLRRK